MLERIFSIIIIYTDESLIKHVKTGNIILILQLRKEKHKEDKQIRQDYTAL